MQFYMGGDQCQNYFGVSFQIMYVSFYIMYVLFQIMYVLFQIMYLTLCMSYSKLCILHYVCLIPNYVSYIMYVLFQIMYLCQSVMSVSGMHNVYTYVRTYLGITIEVDACSYARILYTYHNVRYIIWNKTYIM